MQLDNFGQWAIGAAPSKVYEERVLRLVVDLCEAGFSGQLLLSHDAFNSSQYAAYGGSGFCYISNEVLPRLQELGIGDDTLRQLTVTNPARFLSGAGPQ